MKIESWTKLVLVGICYFFFVSFSYTQDYRCQQEILSVEDGLSNRFVRAIVQDHNGFMWFGTKYGLNRYDGYEFRNFTKENHHLQSNFIHQLYEDPDHNLWVGHGTNNQSSVYFKGIDIFNPESFDIQPIEEKINFPFAINELFRIIPHPITKWLYLTTTTGKVYIYKGGNTFELVYTHSKKSIINSVYIGEEHIWLYGQDELVVLNHEHTILGRQKLTEDIDPERSLFIGETQQGKIWLYTISKDHKEKKTRYWEFGRGLSQDTPFESEISGIQTDNWANFKRIDKNYLYYDKDQINLFDINKKEYYAYTLSGDNFIRTLYIDNQDNIWVALPGEGLLRLYCQKNKFQSFFKGTPLRGITLIQDNNLLIANNYFNAQSHNFKTQQDSTLSINGRELYLSKDQQTLWVSSEKGIVQNIDPYNLKLQSTHAFKKSQIKEKNRITGASMNVFWSLYEDTHNTLWIGTSNGIARLGKGAAYIDILFDYGAYPELATAIIYQFYENREGLWIASSKGLYLMKNGRFLKKYAPTLTSPYYIPHHQIVHLYEDTNGIFWLATKGGGLIRLDPTNGDYKQYTTDEGLSHNVIHAITQDPFQHLWMSSDYGLMRFNPENEVVNIFLPRDGILHEEFNRKSFFKGDDKHLYFGSVSGLIAFNPEDFLTTESEKIPLKIIAYNYFDSENGTIVDKTQQLIKEKKISLNHTDRFFSLAVSLLDYQLNKESKYSYKIEGIDDVWHYITTNKIEINGLAPGVYKLYVRGQGSNGIWSSEALKIPIEVHQPFYLTYTFLILTLLGLACVIFIYWKWRVIRLEKVKIQLENLVQERTLKIEKQAEELKALDTVKSRFFANISHELRTPITLLLGPIEAIIQNQYKGDWQKIKSVLSVVKRNGFKLQNLTDEILTLSALESQKIAVKTEPTYLFRFITEIVEEFKVHAIIKQINLELDYRLDKNSCITLDKNKVEKIINNLLSNAVKYTSEKKNIKLTLSGIPITKDLLTINIQVEDQGSGIHPEDLPYIFDRFYQSKQKDAVIEGGSGIGLSLAYEFSKLIGGTLTVSSVLEKGSVFTFTFPAEIIVETTNQKVIQLPKTHTASSTETTPQYTSSNSSKRNILLVEDHSDMRDFIADILSPQYNIHTAYNGKRALEFLENNTITAKIDLIISDVMMPEMDGFELLIKLKSHPTWSHLPIIMLTARAAIEDKLNALQTGVDDYINKPFLPQELKARVNNLIRNYRKRNEWLKKETINISSKVDTISKGDLMKKARAIVEKEINNTQFGISDLAFQLHVSERQLQRKIRSKTGLTPNQYVRLVKLDTARYYLESKSFETITEVAHKVGFSNVSYFSKIYLTEYGKNPSEYL